MSSTAPNVIQCQTELKLRHIFVVLLQHLTQRAYGNHVKRQWV